MSARYETMYLSGNQQDVLIVLIRQTQRAQEDAKGTRVYIQNQAHEPQKPLQGLDGDPSQYWTEPLINTMTVLLIWNTTLAAHPWPCGLCDCAVLPSYWPIIFVIISCLSLFTSFTQLLPFTSYLFFTKLTLYYYLSPFLSFL
jgi:hypothetical protein